MMRKQEGFSHRMVFTLFKVWEKAEEGMVLTLVRALRKQDLLPAPVASCRSATHTRFIVASS